MEKEFIPYEQALELKELGFDEPCFGYYVPLLDDTQELEIKLIETNGNKIIIAPLYQQAFRWFREKYDLIYFITPEGSINNRGYLYSIKDWKAFVGTFGQTYEEAELKCLKKLIEIVKQK